TAGAAVPWPTAMAQRGDRNAAELIERLPVPVRIEQHLRPPNEQQRRDRPAWPELAFPLPRRIPCAGERVLDPGRAPMRPCFLLRARGEPGVARDQVSGGDAGSQHAGENRVENLF